MKNSIVKSAILINLLFLFGACKDNNPKIVHSSIQDTLEIWADTSLSVLVNEHKKAFENSYNKPFLSIKYMQESQIIENLMKNRLNCAILQRNLSLKEVQYLKEKEDFLPKQYNLAFDAFVFVANKKNPMDVLSVSEIKDCFIKGHTDFQLVFESNHCQAIPYFKSYYNLSTQQISSAYTKPNLNELITLINKDVSSIGIIPFSYISDIEATSTISLLENLKILSVENIDSSGKRYIINPSQESIATKDYPFVMPIVLLNCNMEIKSGTTFVNYMMKPKAQRLFLKCGVVPAKFPAREVNVNTN